MDTLQHFVSRQLRQAFAWGLDDCVTMPADWVAEIAGFDPMFDLRGRYDSLAGCQRLTGFLTDPLRMIAPRMAGADPVPPAQAARGDVGVILLALGGAVQPHGGICLGDGAWVVRGQGGVTVGHPAKVLAAWRIGLVPVMRA